METQEQGKLAVSSESQNEDLNLDRDILFLFQSHEYYIRYYLQYLSLIKYPNCNI